MSGISYTMPRFQAIDQNGRPMVGATLYTYQNKTTTPAPTWHDKDQTAYNTNPIVLDARGEAVVWLDPAQVYTFVLRNWLGALTWSQDDVAGAASQIDLAAPNGAAMVGLPQGGTVSDAVSWVTPQMFGAKGNGVQDDTASIRAMLGSGIKIAHVPPGVYCIHDKILIPNGVSVIGASPDSTVLKCMTPNAGVQVHTDDGYGNRNGILSSIFIDGNLTATDGLYVGLAVQRHFDNIRIEKCVGHGLVVDNSQNSAFQSISLEANKCALYVINGAGNCAFDRVEMTGNPAVQASVNNFVIDVDKSYPGGSVDVGFSSPTENTFSTCVFELSSGSALKINAGNSNIFRGCSLTNAAGAICDIGSAPVNTLFDACYFSGSPVADPSRLALINRGFRTALQNCRLEGWSATAPAIQTYSELFMAGPQILTRQNVLNMAGDIGSNIRTSNSRYTADIPTNAPGGIPSTLLYSDKQVAIIGRTGPQYLYMAESLGGAITTPVPGDPASIQLPGYGAYDLFILLTTPDLNHVFSCKYLATFYGKGTINKLNAVTQLATPQIVGSHATVTSISMTTDGRVLVGTSSGGEASLIVNFKYARILPIA